MLNTKLWVQQGPAILLSILAMRGACDLRDKKQMSKDDPLTGGQAITQSGKRPLQ